MKKTIFEEMGGTYIRHGDYLIPCLGLPEEEQRFIGVWGQRHKRYLKEHKRTVYTTLLTNGRLNSYLADIEEQAQERFERIVEPVSYTHLDVYKRQRKESFNLSQQGLNDRYVIPPPITPPTTGTVSYTHLPDKICDGI